LKHPYFETLKMIEIKQEKEKKENAIIVGVRVGGVPKNIVNDNLDELERLAETAGARILFRVIQTKKKIDPAYFIGKGKIEEIAHLVENSDVSIVLFDDELNPSQIRNIEKLINKKIIDRTGLILDIFASHAKTKEARTQVELAQLEYLYSRLTKAWTHLSKQVGGIGTKGPGEKQIETDRRLIRNRIKILKAKLEKIESQQITKSLKRKDYLKISLVGYTNAGKSTLLNVLTNAGALAEDKLFATLDSTTRSYKINSQNKILISDTVGFIRKLPPTLIASFRSTLNVVRQADVIIHVVDVSSSNYEEQIKIVNKTLKELNSHLKPQILVFNKIDLMKDKFHLTLLLERFPHALFISAVKGINIQKLKDKLNEFYENRLNRYSLKLSINDTKQISRIHKYATVLSTDYADEEVLIKFKTSKKNYLRIRKGENEEANN